HLATDAELFGRLRRPSGRGPRQAATRAQDLTREFTLEFAPEELVVHVDHGIARFKGMRLIETDGAHREYLELEYAEGDRLFVPVENLDRVQKYLGGEGEPTLHRLGTGDWTRARGRARKVVQDVAEDLLRIDRKSTRLNSSHVAISYAVFCLKKKKQKMRIIRGERR